MPHTQEAKNHTKQQLTTYNFMKNRHYFIDNLRWVTVLLVLFYHVFYNFNAVGVFGAIGGFTDHQWQDVVMYPIYPWFMLLMFILAGASSRYALQNRTSQEFRRERTRKLLIPSTLGLFVFGWVLGLLNSKAAAAILPEGTPLLVKYLIAVVSGTGPLWFIQDLFVFSLLLLWVRRIIDVERVHAWLLKVSDRCISLLLVVALFVLWGVAQTQFDHPVNAQGLINLYRPLFYFVAFVMGYYIFSSERIHTYLAAQARWLAVAAVGCAILFTICNYGKDYTHPSLVQSLGYNIFAWVATLAMIGGFKRWADHTSPFANYMTRSSFGVYIVHMTVCTAVCLWLKASGMDVWLIYPIALIATYVGAFVLWEVLHRIPFVRYCVFGIKRKEVK